MDVETTSPTHHLILGGGIVRGCTVLCVAVVSSELPQQSLTIFQFPYLTFFSKGNNPFVADFMSSLG